MLTQVLADKKVRRYSQRPPGVTLLALKASIEVNPEWNLKQHADALGITRERVRQLTVAYELPTWRRTDQARLRRETEWPRCNICKGIMRKGAKRADHFACHREASKASCTGCGVVFVPSNRAKNQSRYASDDRRFHSWDCMNEWKSKNGDQWFVRRKPAEWGFGGRKKVAV